jgi:hypothetical protein
MAQVKIKVILTDNRVFGKDSDEYEYVFNIDRKKAGEKINQEVDRRKFIQSYTQKIENVIMRFTKNYSKK